jgi:hypothetical protein
MNLKYLIVVLLFGHGMHLVASSPKKSPSSPKNSSKKNDSGKIWAVTSSSGKILNYCVDTAVVLSATNLSELLKYQNRIVWQEQESRSHAIILQLCCRMLNPEQLELLSQDVTFCHVQRIDLDFITEMQKFHAEHGLKDCASTAKN